MAIIFDEINKIILIEAPQTEITCQELYNACKDFEELWNGIDNPQVCECTGKQTLGPTKKVGLTLALLDDWRIQFEDRAQWTACSVKDGNFVPTYQSGWMPILQSNNTFVIVEQDVSAAIVLGAGAGEDWTDAEKQNIRDALGVTGTKQAATGGQLQDIETKVDSVQTDLTALAVTLARVLGLAGEHQRIKDQVYDSNEPPNMTSATLRIYANAADCQNDVNPTAEYSITATFTGNKCTSYFMVKV